MPERENSKSERLVGTEVLWLRGFLSHSGVLGHQGLWEVIQVTGPVYNIHRGLAVKRRHLSQPPPADEKNSTHWLVGNS